MKKQRSLLIVLIGFLVILVGAYITYNHLSDTYKPDSLLAVPGSTTGDGQSGTPETAVSAPETDSTSDTTEETSAVSETEDSPEQELYAAPDFTVYDYEGSAYKLSDFIGKPVVLNFWASWCGPCKSEMPEFDVVYLEQGDKIQFLMVNLTDNSRETKEIAKEFIDGAGYSFPVFYDTDIDAATKYSVSSIPATYFIDKDGYLIAYGIGALDAESLARGIEMITAANE